jgi:hypothetical protein
MTQSPGTCDSTIYTYTAARVLCTSASDMHQIIIGIWAAIRRLPQLKYRSEFKLGMCIVWLDEYNNIHRPGVDVQNKNIQQNVRRF